MSKISSKRIKSAKDRILNKNCGICFKPIMDKSTIDHIIPKSKGGTNKLSNLQLAHLECNRKKGNK